MSRYLERYSDFELSKVGEMVEGGKYSPDYPYVEVIEDETKRYDKVYWTIYGVNKLSGRFEAILDYYDEEEAKRIYAFVRARYGLCEESSHHA
jgi:hypothetical protein